MKSRLLKILLFIIIHTRFAFTTSLENSYKAFLEKKGPIVFDIRGSRGGKGDVAASYLMAMEFIERFGYDKKFYFIIDREANKILKKLSAKNKIFKDKVTAITMDNYPKDKTIGLYFQLAKPSGVFYNKHEFTEVSEAEQSSSLKTYDIDLPISKETVLVNMPVLGNTENIRSVMPFGTVKKGSFDFLTNAPGISEEENGIYYDYVANSLKDIEKDELKNRVQNFIKIHITNKIRKNNLLKIISKKERGGRKIGLVYGITHKRVKSQFESYLKGLIKTNSAYVLITPSGISMDQIESPVLKNKIAIYDLEEISQKKLPNKKKILIVKTGSLPHPVFISLMAFSQIPPIVSGDSAMSAAIQLGRDFASTRIEWNENNLDNYLNRLFKADSTKGDKIEKYVAPTFSEGNMTNIIHAKKLKSIYHKASREVPFLSDSMLKRIILVDKLVQNGKINYSREIDDMSVPEKASYHLHHAMQGDFNSMKAMLRSLVKFSERSIYDMFITVAEKKSSLKDFLGYIMIRNYEPYRYRGKNIEVAPKIIWSPGAIRKTVRALDEGEKKIIELIGNANRSKETESIEFLVEVINRSKIKNSYKLYNYIINLAKELKSLSIMKRLVSKKVKSNELKIITPIGWKILKALTQINNDISVSERVLAREVNSLFLKNWFPDLKLSVSKKTFKEYFASLNRLDSSFILCDLQKSLLSNSDIFSNEDLLIQVFNAAAKHHSEYSLESPAFLDLDRLAKMPEVFKRYSLLVKKKKGEDDFEEIREFKLRQKSSCKKIFSNP